MNVEIGAKAVLFPEKEYISGIFVAVWPTTYRKMEKSHDGERAWSYIIHSILSADIFSLLPSLFGVIFEINVSFNILMQRKLKNRT
jgi:hypothetical protein